jgi:Skp family chaperone for outer membrane proteins
MRPLQFAGVTGISLAALLLALNANLASPNVAGAAVTKDKDIPDAHVAICSVVAITDELMASDRFRPDIDANADKLRDDLIKPIVEEGKSLEQALKDADSDDPANNDRKKRLLELREAAQQAQQRAGIEQEKFVANKTIEAYEMATASARAIAKDMGFNYVVASIGPDEELTKDMPMSAVRNAILGRPMVMMPDGVDISDAVRDDLHLE